MRRAPLAILSVLAVLLVLTPAVAQDNATSAVEEIEGPTDDVSMYARDNSVTIAEAERRLEVQSEVQALRGRLSNQLGDTYAGIWIEHQPRFHVFVASVKRDMELVREELQSELFKGDATVVEVEASISDLVAIASEIRDASPVPINTATSVSDNVAKVYVAASDSNELFTSPQLAVLLDRREVVVEVVDALARPASGVHAGMQLSGGTGCTSGYSVRRGTDGMLGITTAAHCGNPGEEPDPNFIIDGSSMNFQEAKQDGSWDLQWHTVPGRHIDNQLQYENNNVIYHREVTGFKWSWEQGQGDYVCKSGNATHYTCGYVTDSAFCYGDPDTCNHTFMLVHKASGSMADHGDSGGPVFLLNDALGITVGIAGGENPPWDMIYMPVGYVSIFSLQVLTSEPPTCAGLPVTHVGTAGNDEIVGTAGNDVIQGLGGDDVIDGGGGNDIICGSDGDDWLIGNSGNDQLYGNAGNDFLGGGAGSDYCAGSYGTDQAGSCTTTVGADVMWGDWQGDAAADLLAWQTNGTVWMYPGTGQVGNSVAEFGTRQSVRTGFWTSTWDRIFGAGDTNGDGHPDFYARQHDGDLYLYKGKDGHATESAMYAGYGWDYCAQLTSPGDWDQDGDPDLFCVDSGGKLLFPMPYPHIVSAEGETKL